MPEIRRTESLPPNITGVKISVVKKKRNSSEDQIPAGQMANAEWKGAQGNREIKILTSLNVS